jgi:hypothetical protein
MFGRIPLDAWEVWLRFGGRFELLKGALHFAGIFDVRAGHEG